MPDLNYSDVVEISAPQSKQRLLEMLDDVEFIATSWQEGSLSATHVEMTAEVEARLSKIVVFLKKLFMSGTATGEALTRTSSGFYDNTRNDAIASQHLVTLSCLASAGPHTIHLGDVVVVHPDGHSYRNIEGNSVVYPVVLASGGTQTLLFECETAGAQSNIGNALTPTAVTLSLDTTLAGTSITAHTLYLAGVDEESDERLDERNTSKWAILAEGELIDDAVEFLALRASASIIHVKVDSTNPRGAGTFDVYIAGLDATASDDDVAKAQVAIQNRFFGATAVPPACQVKKSPTVNVSIAGTVYYTGTASQASVQSAVETALLAFIRATPSGGYDYSPGPRGIIRKNDIESVIRQAVETLTERPATVELTTPSGDIGLSLFDRPIFVTPLITYQPVTSNQ